MKVLLGTIPILLLIALIPSISALSYEGTSLSNPNNFLDFTIGEQLFTPKQFTYHSKYAIDHGTITLNGVLIPLADSKISTYGDGKSFVLRDSIGISMFGTETRPDVYNVIVSTWNGNSRVKETFIISEAKPIVETPPVTAPTTEESIASVKKAGPEIKLVVKNPIVGYLENSYPYALKVFEARHNPSDIYDQSLGHIKTAKITGKIYNPSGVLQKEFEGELNQAGIFVDSWKVPFRSTLVGPYTLEISAVVEFPDGSVSYDSEVKNFFVDQPIDHSKKKEP